MNPLTRSFAFGSIIFFCLILPMTFKLFFSARLRSGVRQILATDAAFTAIKDDGTVVTWGGRRSHKPLGLVDVQQVVPNEGAFAAIKSDERVVTWGDPAFGGDSSEVSFRWMGEWMKMGDFFLFLCLMYVFRQFLLLC